MYWLWPKRRRPFAFSCISSFTSHIYFGGYIDVYIIFLDCHFRGSLGIEFIVHFGRHQQRSNCCAANKVEPDRPPPECLLQGTNGHETNRCRDGTAAINETSNGTETLVVATHGWMRGQIGGNGRRDNVVWPIKAKAKMQS
jgi:hypothetical protein